MLASWLEEELQAPLVRLAYKNIGVKVMDQKGNLLLRTMCVFVVVLL